MRAIVTGANGFIGSSLIKKLISDNIEVLAIDLSFANSRLPDSSLITLAEMSVDNIAEIEAGTETGKYDIFYHLAWRGVNGADKGNVIAQTENIEMAAKCAMTAKNIGCRKLLCSGTVAEQAVKSLPLLEKTGAGMLYGVAKACTRTVLEAYCKNVGLDFVWMQFSNIYGPQNKTGNLVSYTIGELTSGRAASFGPAMQPYDFILVDDLIDAVYRLGVKNTSKNFYYIGSGEPRLLKDYLYRIGEIYGKPDLIHIGERADDGIKYDYSMFDNSELVSDVGGYVTKSFEDGIRFTIENMSL